MFNLTASSRAARAHVAILTVSLVAIFFFCAALVSTRVARAFRAPSTASAVAARSDQVVLSGYVVYTTGEPAKGINVVMSGARSGATVTDGGGHYEFTVDSVCGAGVVINFTASSDEIVDGAPLAPAEANISGCIVTDHEMPQMTMFYPKVILFDGYVRDTTGAGVGGVTITIRREKYDLNPPAVETSTTTTGADGRYFYPSYARCSVDYTFTAVLAGATIVPPSVGFSGCILQDFTVHEFTVTAAPTPPDANAAQNDGRPPCNSQVGEPVNVTNGNVYLDQTDYRLPGIGNALEITRSYNSDRAARAGLFGRGWTTALNESIETISPSLLRLNLPDGRAVLFDSASGVFLPRESANFHARLTRDSSGTFTLTTLGESVQRFDANGKLISTADRYGNLTLLTYDANGGLASVNDPSGRRLSVESDGSRRVVALSDSLGMVATYSYGAGGELLSVNYPDGSGFHFNYTPSPAGAPLLTSVTDARGETVEAHTYDSRGRAVSSERDGGVERTTLNYVSDTETDATDARGHVTKFFIDRTRGRNVVTRVEGACSCGGSQVQSWTYDAAARQTSATNALGQRTDYAYDTDGNLLTITDALGRTSYTYNARGQVLTATDASSATTFNTYDASGKLITRRDALGNTTTFAYDARSLLTNFTDARAHTLSLAYDSSGNLTRAVDAAGNATTYTYDARSRLTGERDALGGATAYEYDAVNRPTKITRADGATINLAYDTAGRLIKANDPRGLATAYAYDGAGRLITVTDAAGGTTNYGYDQLSNLTSMTDELGRTTDYEYDEFRRLTRAVYPAAEAGAPRLSESFEHDALGNILRVTDTTGRATSFDYDAASRVVRVTDPLLQATRYEYDALSRVTAVTDALGQRYGYSYDALGRVTGASRADVSVSFAYDSVGNLSRRTDYAGATTAYDYDELDRLTRISYPDASVSVFEYDALSRLTAATNRQGAVRFAYDALSRLARTTDVFGQTLAYAYDADGNRTSLSVNAAPYLSYQYDALNRLTRETDAAGAAVTYSYDAASRQTARTLPNGVATAYAYDDLNRLTRLTDSAGANTFSDRQYSYDAASNLTQTNEPTGASSFSYDALDRIVAAAQPAQSSESYAYDAVGNRTRSHRSATYAYQSFNRLTATGAATYAYDAAGNVVSKTDGAGATDLTWDAAHRLTGVRLPDGSAVAYAYDALGRRVSTVNTDRRNRRSTTTSYTYDGADVLRETTDDGRKPTTTDYLRGAGTDDLLRQTTRAQHGRPDTYYHLADRQGSTRLLTDERARVAARLDYDTFGDGAGSPLTRYAYTGRERDDQTGIYYYRARWYDPQLGRFLSEDPIGLAGGMNMYSYVSNNPTNKVDPSGLYESDVHYYLTYFLASKHKCFTERQARLIADADQNTDENPDTAPGPGFTDKQMEQNMDYHALHGLDHKPFLNNLWEQATDGPTNYVGLGRYLHYVQDTFSHAGFTNPRYGHLFGTHAADKTDEDVFKALRMVGATWEALNKYAKEERCGCQDRLDPSLMPQILDFLLSPGGDDITRYTRSIEDADPIYLERKRQILSIPQR
jgi:RHS repeat-associated protein